MPYPANYQRLTGRNPYLEQANAPGPDRGLWSVLGRAIRSQAPERRNAAYNPEAPVTEDNLPYQKPGFFRALIGDRGADYNDAALLNELDLDTENRLAGKQAQQFRNDVNFTNEQANNMAQLDTMRRGVLQWLADKNALARIIRQGQDRMGAINAGIKGRERIAQIPRVLGQSPGQEQRNTAQAEYYRQRAEAERAKAANEKLFGEQFRVQPQMNNATPQGWMDKFWNFFSGGNQAQPPSTQATSPAITGAPAPAEAAAGEIPIDPQDALKFIQAQQGGGMLQIDDPRIRELLTEDDLINDDFQ